MNLDTIARSLKIAQESHRASGCPHPIRGWVMQQNVSDVHLPNQDGMNEAQTTERKSTRTDDQVSLLCLGCDTCNFLEIVV